MDRWRVTRRSSWISLKISQKEENMSNSQNNREQDQLIEQTPTQRNPGSARATDFKIEERDGGQRSEALLAEADSDGKSQRGELIPERNEVPHKTR
jgi:hypothetical protein